MKNKILLIAALVATFKVFGTLELQDLFAKASTIAEAQQTTEAHLAIAWLLMLGIELENPDTILYKFKIQHYQYQFPTSKAMPFPLSLLEICVIPSTHSA